MKLTISYAEAVALITRTVFSSATFDGKPVEVIISRPEPQKKADKSFSLTPTEPLFWRTIEGLSRHDLEVVLANVDRQGNFNNKIAAIKALRALTGYGLKDAKDAVENWPAFHKACCQLNRWPYVYDNGTRFE